MLIEHTGIGYSSLISNLVRARGARTYLEIGVCHGDNLSCISCDVAIGVDPGFQLKDNVAAGKRDLHLFQCTSDSFFERGALRGIAPNGIDFAFLDGMHLFEFLLRDFYKTEHNCRNNSLIAMHDCFPLNAEMTERVPNPSARQDQTLAGSWTGDVWKIIPILKKYRPDLMIKGVKAPPTGLLFVGDLDPSSDKLERCYSQIVSEFKSLDSSETTIKAAFDAIEILETQCMSAIDHTLHFIL
jgi:hypothetical protein